MKKLIVSLLVVILIILMLLTCENLFFYDEGATVNSESIFEPFVKIENKEIHMNKNGKYMPFEIKGVRLGSSLPGKSAADEETYKRWFYHIQKMGANTISVSTIQNDAFYNAFYDYNLKNDSPLYMLHGIAAGDYVQNSHSDAYSKEFYDIFLDSSKTMIDVVHGNKKIARISANNTGHGTYKKDVSPWVIGYIIGDGWNDLTVAYTDDLYSGQKEYTSYRGKYLYTTYNATPFETMLTMVGDQVIEYETNQYGKQRLITFSNNQATDPFEYPKNIQSYILKCAYINVEHIKTTRAFVAGQLASYSISPYDLDFLSLAEDWSVFGLESKENYEDEQGKLNTFKAYLEMLANHHNMPVVISEFGVSSARGTDRLEKFSEKEQGDVLAKCWKDLEASGINGGCISAWQDEWGKTTWNTMHAVNTKRAAFWSDYQSADQHFGLLSFDPGNEKSVCYTDGDANEWTDDDKVIDGDTSLSIKYDEKFVYFLVEKNNFDFENETVYIPLDITQKSGSKDCTNFDIKFDRDVDFIIVLNGKDESRIMVSERYDALRSTYAKEVYKYDTYLKYNIPDKNSPKFVNISLPLYSDGVLSYGNKKTVSQSYETGKLLYGNANPDRDDFNSLADFCASGDYIEVKIPWQTLNFADPSTIQIHDDYYDGNYGVDFIKIDKMYAGVGTDSEMISLGEIKLKGWKNKVTYHERLKSSYYIMQNLWNESLAK